MHPSKRISLLGGILLAAGLLFALTPTASTAFAATRGAANASKASASTAPAFSLRPASASAACESSCSINGCPPGEADGAINDWVAVIQFRLNFLIGAGLTTDGHFGSATKTAVTNFQNDVGISNGGGAVGDRTWSAMGFCLGFSTIFLGDSGTTSKTICPAAESNGGSDDPIFVTAIQDLLNVDYNAGVFPNSPNNFKPYLASDGSFGPLTQNAVNDFQLAVGISGGGGAVGQRTWSELGMCS